MISNTLQQIKRDWNYLNSISSEKKEEVIGFFLSHKGIIMMIDTNEHHDELLVENKNDLPLLDSQPPTFVHFYEIPN